MRVRNLPPLLGLTLALGACGAEEEPAAAPAPAIVAEPALARPARAGEIVIRGEASPAAHGPYALRGRYLVRFEQWAPEDPDVDFGTQTRFVAELAKGDVRRRSLFDAAQRRGRRGVRLDGRYRIEVAFGDFPYVIRLTPRRG